jgi:hypothetical protein
MKIKRVREAGCYDRLMRIMAERKELEISTPLVAYTGHVAGTLFLTDFGYDYNILPTIISTKVVFTTYMLCINVFAINENFYCTFSVDSRRWKRFLSHQEKAVYTLDKRNKKVEN